MARFAQIDSDPGMVSNVIVAEPGSDYFDSEYAKAFIWVDIDALVPMPWIGWAYENGTFIPPQEQP